MALSLQGRALHFVFKVGDRRSTAHFYKDILGMQPLRHEEFSEGCEAACNGPYANRWSKTMIGYGPEDTHFAVELTYNYGVKSYDPGNDFLGITIKSMEVIQRATKTDYPIEELNGNYILKAPDGYKFNIIGEPQPKDEDPIQKVTLACSDLKKTIEYWNGILGLKIFSQADKAASFGFDTNQCLIEFKDIGRPIDHAKAYGRVAFSVPEASLSEIQSKMEAEKQTILKPLISLDTPGKASVSVVILADPDGHEICFVGDEAFRKLSKMDPKADHELSKYIRSDKS